MERHNTATSPSSTPAPQRSITAFLLLRRSLRFYWRTHLGVLLGTAVTGAILTGALVVGDSVRHTLEQLALARLGRTTQALISPGHFFRAGLADDLAEELNATAPRGDGVEQRPAPAITVAPLLMLRGSAAWPDGRARANDVQVIGVEERFWKLGGTTNLLDQEDIAVNQRLSDQLGLRPGDTVVVRVEQPSLISRDAPLSGRRDASVALRARVRAIAGDRDFGRFSLRANQVSPNTVFFPLSRLQDNLSEAGRASVLLTDAAVDANPALRKRWTLADAGLEVRDDPPELRTDRVFLDPVVAPAALALSPQAAGVLTYFVNEIRFGDKATPYSFVTAVGHDQRDDEITINSWLAEDLGAKPGDELRLRYFVIGDRRALAEQSATFRVGRVVPLQSDPSWMPGFPGLADVGNCREWEPGIPIAADRIRPKDEDYWNRYRGTPKAFVTLAAGQRLWSNRFGNLTAVRYPLAGEAPAEPRLAGTLALQTALRAKLDPAALGLSFVPVRDRALRASRQSMDFGQLFIGFSFFLIVAALLLTAMLFVFNLEQRHTEAGLLRALGFRPRQVQRIMLVEGLCLAAAGTLIGVPAGMLYTKLALYGLSTVWQQAVGTTAFRYHAGASRLALGAGLSLLAAWAALWLAQRGQARRAPAQLLGSGAEMELGGGRPQAGWRIGAFCLLGATAVLLFSGAGKNPTAFFSAGALLLIAGLGFSQRLLVGLTRSTRTAGGLAAVGWRNAARRRGRSLTTISVLASGVFLLVAVNAFHQDPRPGAGERHSGTGGFALYARSALPVYDDLNSPAGRDLFGLTGAEMKDVAVLPLRVREGDDASCLNLNRAQQPRLLGVNPEELARRGAFVFVGQASSLPTDGRRTTKMVARQWELLDEPQTDGAVPAIGDEATVRWALGKKLGDTLPYADERGRTFQLRIVGVLANSVLQGSLLISEENFINRFPGEAGYRVFLIDAPGDRSAVVAQALSRGLQDRGLEVVPAWGRLAEFLAVENTYLGIFQALGGLGLLLGSLGLGLVALRNVLERRGELALLQAVGFRRPTLRRLILGEHGLLIFLGLAIGLIAAGLAVWPAGRSPGTEAPVGLLIATLVGIALGGVGWSWLAAWVALRGPLLPALRNE